MSIVCEEDMIFAAACKKTWDCSSYCLLLLYRDWLLYKKAVIGSCL